MESLREVVQDFLVPELKWVKVSIDSLHMELKLSIECLHSKLKVSVDSLRGEMAGLRHEMRLQDEKQT